MEGARLDRWGPPAAWALVGVGATLWGAAIVFGLRRPPSLEPLRVSDVIWALSFTGFLVIGGIIATRNPRNPIGWCFVVGVCAVAAGVAAPEYGSDLTRPGAVWLVVLGQTSFAAGVPLLSALWLALYPDGHVLGSRWRWVVPAIAVAATLMVVGALLGPVGVDGGPSPPRPSALAGTEAAGDALSTVGGAMMMVLSLVAVWTLILRYRRGAPQIRAQLRWLLLVAGLVLLLGAVTFLLHRAGFEGLGGFTGYLTFVTATIGLSGAVAVAVTRHRLYDIDRLISRTVAYTIVSVLLLAIYASLVLGLEQVVRPVVGSSHDLVIATSTLAAAAAFQPLRRRVQRRVDHRFNRRRTDAVATTEAFARRLRDELDLTAVTQDLRRSVDLTLAPAHVEVLLVERPR
jgi:hypothetical protein